MDKKYNRINFGPGPLTEKITARSLAWQCGLAEATRRLIRIGLMIADIMDDPQKRLYVQSGDKTIELYVA